MYDSLGKVSGIEAVHQYLSNYQVEVGPDGLSLVTGDGGNYGADVALPERLREFLIDLRLLRHLPLAYLVPDAALLPPESIRFFHVDPTWVDRIIDGVFAAANTGTVDFVFSYSMLQMARSGIDKELTDLAKAQVPGTGWTGDKPMTGMLIRSELARRWPDVIVRAYTSAADPADPTVPTMPVLRAEPISKDIYIALFAGQPQMVHVREPNVGTRYGVEARDNPTPTHPYQVDSRPTDGNTPENATPIVLSYRGASNLRILNLNALATDSNSAEDSPRQVALNLEQLPYVQEFKHLPTHQESRGSTNPATLGTMMSFRRNRSMTLGKFIARQAELDEMES
jgi:hypothetical protein